MKERGPPREDATSGDDPSSMGETVASDSAPLAESDEAELGKKKTTARRAAKKKKPRMARRHPDIEVARLLVKRGFVKKKDAVEALRVQKARAQGGKARVPFLKLLVSRGVLEAARLSEAQDEIRRNTYICEACEARAVILAGSQTRAGACPRCGHEISVAHQSSAADVPAREFRPRTATTGAGATGGPASSETEPWRPMEEEIGELAAGQQAFGKYKLLEELGRGAMGIVYRARHTELGKDVALKVLIPGEENRESQVARFRREAAAVQKLRHDGIVAVHDFGSEGDVYYLTMDLVEGGDSLHRALKRKEPLLGLRRRVEVLCQVAEAVAHAHERGVIHRDLKPANVLIRPDGRAVVVDFGLAKDEGDEGAELTRTHDRLGTPLFMAPEQIRRGASAVDARADVWALGVMLFVCVTGRYPFRSRTVMDLYLRIMREEPDWEGTKYSAPDRAGMLQGREPRPSELDAGKQASSKDPFVPSTVDSDEITELASRTGPDGTLPKQLPAALSDDRPLGPLPPPFVPPPELPESAVPPDLRLLVQCALAKDPEDRYPTAMAFAEDLRRWMEGRPIEARRPSAWKRLREQLRRRRVLARLALASFAGAVLLGAALGAKTWLAGQEERAERTAALEKGRAALASLAVEKVGEASGLLELHPPESPEELLLRAKVRLRLLRLADAQADLERAETLVADGAEREAVLRERSLLELLQGREAQGVAYAMRALQVSTAPAPETVERLAQAVFARHAREPGSDLSREVARLEEACKALAARPPTSEAPLRGDVTADLPAWLAHAAILRGKLDEASALVPAELDPERAPFSFLVARGRIELLLARSRGPGEEEAHRAGMKRAGDLLDEARERWRVLSRVPGEQGYFNLLGYNHKLKKESALAAAANRASSALAPFYVLPRAYLGRLFLTNGADLEGAEGWYRAALELDPFHEESRAVLLAILLLDPKREREARALIEESRELGLGGSAPTIQLAWLHLRAGRAGEAALLLESIPPGDPATRRAPLVQAVRARITAGPGGDPSFPPAAALEDLCEGARALWERGDAAGAEALLLPDPDRDLIKGRSTTMLVSMRHALLCRFHAASGRSEAAVEALHHALFDAPGREGYDWKDPLSPSATPAHLLTCPELEKLVGDPKFEALKQGLYQRRESVAAQGYPGKVD